MLGDLMGKLGGRCPLDAISKQENAEFMRGKLREFYTAQNIGLSTSPYSNLSTYAQVSHGKDTRFKVEGEKVTDVVRNAVLKGHYIDPPYLKEEYCRRVCPNILC